jgi:hypothetical protein
MPSINLSKEVLTVELPDLVEGSTIIKRKAKFLRLIYQPQEKEVTIVATIQHYTKNEDGSYGNTLLFTREKVMTARNESLVDITNGTLLCSIGEEFSQPEGGEPVLNPLLENKNYAMEFDYYDHIANTTPVVINELITQRILAAFPQ